MRDEAIFSSMGNCCLPLTDAVSGSFTAGVSGQQSGLLVISLIVSLLLHFLLLLVQVFRWRMLQVPCAEIKVKPALATLPPL